MALHSIDNELSASVQAGLSTFNARYERLDLLARTTNFAARSLRNRHKGEDIAVDAYLRIHKKVESDPNYISRDGQLVAVAFKTTSNLCCDATRRKDYNSVWSFNNPIPIDGGMLMMSADDVVDKREAFGVSEAWMVLEQLIPNIPERFRDPIILLGVLGMSQQEAADTLGLTLLALKTRLYHGRQQLRVELEEAGLSLACLVPRLET